LAPYCTLDQKWSAKGATPVQMMRWGEGEAEKFVNEDEPLTPIVVQAHLIAFIYAAILLEGEYNQIPGGFPDYAYWSCLKGKPITPH
jgi:hypothetical protein